MRSFIASIFMVLLLTTVVGAADPEWPCWRGINRDGRSPDTGLLKEWPAEGPKLLWKTEGINHGFSSPVVAGGSIYITGDTDDKKLMLYKLSMDGAIEASAEIAPAWTGQHAGSRSSPTFDKGKLYLVSANGKLICLDAKNFKEIWFKDFSDYGVTKAPTWGFAESVLIHENLVIFTPGGKEALAAVDKETGKPVWTSQGFGAKAHYCSPIAFQFGGKTLVVNGTGDGLVGVDAKTGTVQWTDPFCVGNTANCPTPAFSDGYVFWANGYRKGGICLQLTAEGDKVTATKVWNTMEMVNHHGGYIIDKGYIYGNHNQGWTCLELKTGLKKWYEAGVGKGSICYADGMLYTFSEKDGQAGLVQCTPDEFKMTGKVKVAGKGMSWAHPVVIGGRLYLRYDTTLYCFDVKNK